MAVARLVGREGQSGTLCFDKQVRTVEPHHCAAGDERRPAREKRGGGGDYQRPKDKSVLLLGSDNSLSTYDERVSREARLKLSSVRHPFLLTEVGGFTILGIIP
jgi:hypothetical protein